jgi:hypothetical protein
VVGIIVAVNITAVWQQLLVGQEVGAGDVGWRL